MDSEKLIVDGYKPTEEECNNCEEGELWANSYEVTCINCSITYRLDDIRESVVYKITDFYEDRPVDDSGNIIPQGGFESAYTDWNPNET